MKELSDDTVRADAEQQARRHEEARLAKVSERLAAVERGAQQTLLNTTKIEVAIPVSKLTETQARMWLAETRRKIELVEAWLASRPPPKARK